ncbi:MAG: MBL fold metallo-hydrolase [Candidatus Brocadiaceae bacterium]|nr:MBL fold metallo-hydrolase [Candidatus Brocadiaceae bacterium]
MNVGNMEVLPIECGGFRLDGGSMFGVVPKGQWERHAPADEDNRIAIALRAMLVRAGPDVILVDTGIGEDLPHKMRDTYAVDHEDSSLARSLKEAGLGLADITHVILTHLHFDHAGGATRIAPSGRMAPTFPNATYYVQRRQYDWAVAPEDYDGASYLPENFASLKEKGCLELLDGEAEIAAGVTVVPVHGHTPGQQLVEVSAKGESLLYCADLIPTTAHVHVPWIMSYDLEPLVTVREKRALLEVASAGGWTLFYEHDPRVVASAVAKTAKGYRIAEPIVRAHSAAG